MDIHRSGQFKRWVDQLVVKAKAGDPAALRMAKHVVDELDYLKALDAEPDEDTATLKWVRQSKKYRVWRLSHPFDPQMAVRIICWFDPLSDAVVVVLFAADKAPMGVTCSMTAWATARTRLSTNGRSRTKDNDHDRRAHRRVRPGRRRVCRVGVDPRYQ